MIEFLIFLGIFNCIMYLSFMLPLHDAIRIIVREELAKAQEAKR